LFCDNTFTNSNDENMKMLKNLTTGRILTSIIVIFMLSWMTLLTSCTAVVRTPRHPRTHIVVGSQVTVRSHDNGWHRGRIERHERRNHRDRH